MTTETCKGNHGNHDSYFCSSKNSNAAHCPNLRRGLALGAAALAGVAIAGGSGAHAANFKTLYRFCAQGGASCTDGAYPGMGFMDRWGNLYSTTEGGGAYGQGTVFELTPKVGADGQTTWAETVLYSFCAQGGTRCTDGAIPVGATLVMDASGNLYGTTFFGGVFGDAAAGTGGTVFELTPNVGAWGQKTWTLKTLYNFCARPDCTDGQKPSAGVVIDAAGNLYGGAEDGGVDNPVCDFGPHRGCGTVFELSPNEFKTNWTYKILYSFCAQGGTSCPDGNLPETNMTLDPLGRLYGTTTVGGANGGGTVWELTPNPPEPNWTHTNWTHRVLYSFCAQGGANCTDGRFPQGISFLAGRLYGPTFVGGAHNAASCEVSFPLLTTVGCGVVWELTPGADQTTWTENVLYSFCSEPGCADGATPEAYMIMDASGRLFSTTAAGGAHNATLCNIGFQITSVGCGTVFELTPNVGAAGTTWTHKVLYSFCAQGGANCTDGANPYSNLMLDWRGRFYGTALDGGANGFGTAFELLGTDAKATVASRSPQ